MKTFKTYIREQEQHKSGEFWQTKPGIWGGKNPDGEIEYYDGGNAKQMSQAWAKGQTKKRGKVSADGDPKVAGGKEPEKKPDTKSEPEKKPDTKSEPETKPEPEEKSEPVRKPAPEKDDYSGQGVRNIIESSDKETLEINLKSHSMQTVPQLDNDRRVDRGFSDEEILEIHAHDPELAKKFGRVIEMEDGSLKGVGGGYAHAQKHGHEFDHAGGFDHVIKETLSAPDMHLKSRGSNMEITRVKNVDGKEKFVVMISDSNDKFITMYNADAATEAQAGNKSILKTFQNMAKSGDAGIQVKGDEAHLIMQEGDSGVKKIVYRREGNKVTIESKVMSKEEHQAEMDGFESASKSQLKKGQPFKGMFADVPPNNQSVNLESLITTAGTVKEEYVIESINEAKYYRNYLDDMQDDKLRNAIVGSGIRVYTDSSPDGKDARQYVIKNGSVNGWEEENGKYVINKDAFYSKDKDPTEKDDMSNKDKLTLHPKMNEAMKQYVDWMKK